MLIELIKFIQLIELIREISFIILFIDFETD